MAEAKASILLVLLLFLAILEATLSVNSEWKKFENGKVQSEAHENAELSKNKTEAVPEGKKKQHILHSHHGEKLNRLKDKNGENSQPNEMDESADQVETHKPNKDRHHRKNAEKMLHSGHNGEVNKQPTSSANPNDEQRQKQEKGETKTEDSKDDEVRKKLSSKRSKPDGVSTIQWRRGQKQEERRKMAKAKEIAEAWLNRTDHIHSQKTKKKKYVIKKMDGNNHAKKLWTEAFKGPNRLVLK